MKRNYDLRHRLVDESGAALVVAVLFVSMGARVRTPNFIVETADPTLAKQIAAKAEQCRRELAVSWLGKAMPNWAFRGMTFLFGIRDAIEPRSRVLQEVRLEPGDHVLELVRPGYVTEEVPISVPAGERIEVDLTLRQR